MNPNHNDDSSNHHHSIPTTNDTTIGVDDNSCCPMISLQLDNTLLETIEALRLEAIFYPKFDNEQPQDRLRAVAAHHTPASNNSNRNSVMGLREQWQQQQQQPGRVQTSGRVGHNPCHGYLEVSLKHSGSLVLWSGDDALYSKNATANVYSVAAHVLLKHHFFRMAAAALFFYNHDGSIDKAEAQAEMKGHSKEGEEETKERKGKHLVRSTASEELAAYAEQLYQECSNYIRVHRLTLSFEVMIGSSSSSSSSSPSPSPHSSLWGDHGQRPQQDYLILTCVADRDRECFYTTPQLLQLAHRFYLPHNDYAFFIGGDRNQNRDRSVTDSTATTTIATHDHHHHPQDLFELYDAYRTTGLASTFVPALQAAATLFVPSMYPHHVYQGDILEGVVVRYVPLNHNPSNDNNKVIIDQQMLEWSQWKLRAQEILRRVSETPSMEVLIKNRLLSPPGTSHKRDVIIPRVYTTTLRDVVVNAAASCDDDDALSTRVTQALMELLDYPRHAIPVRIPKKVAQALELSQYLGELRNTHRMGDLETARIATLLHTIAEFESGVEFSLFCKPPPPSFNNNNKASSSSSAPRYYLIVHILHDWIFPKFEKLRKPHEMKLFRGFVIELISRNRNSSDSTGTLSASTDCPVSEICGPDHERVDTHHHSTTAEPTLMVKLKFLPYMVRTFGCRNGLRVIQTRGEAAFVQYTRSLLKKWDMSAASTIWLPYFAAWARYVIFLLQREHPERTIEEANYLDALEEFNRLYDCNALPRSVGGGGYVRSVLRGLVVVVAIHRRVASAVVDALALSMPLNKGGAGVQRLSNLKDVSIDHLWLWHEPGCGIIATAEVAGQDLSLIRKLFRPPRAGDSYTRTLPPGCVTLVLVGCTAHEFNSYDSKDVNANEHGKIKGMMSGWRKLKQANMLELCRSSIPDNQPFDETAINDTAEELLKLSISIPTSEKVSKKRVLLFCPGIPGCGKSSIFDSETNLLIQTSLQPKYHNLVVLRGDQVKKFWPNVSSKLNQAQSSVLIADKNAPLPSWSTIADVTTKSNSVAVAILFPTAVQTTTIFGARNANGELIRNTRHCYPFTLEFLAVCMLRIIDRNPGSHEGKLDSGTSRACMIVAMFFGFYRGLTAEDFDLRLRSHFEDTGAVLLHPSMDVPFFLPNRASVPRDLHDLLYEAIQTNFGCELSRQLASKNSTAYLDELETRLRAALILHRTVLSSLTVDENTSRQCVTAKIPEVVEKANALELIEESSRCPGSTLSQQLVPPQLAPPQQPFVSLAAIDVTLSDVQNMLHRTSNDARFRDFWDQVHQHPHKHSPSTYSSPLWIRKPHVTLAHCSQMEQTTLYSTYGPLEGESVSMQVTALLWSLRVAALAIKITTTPISSSPPGIEILVDKGREESSVTATTTAPSPETSSTTCTIPAIRNEFPHITIWCHEDASPVESNDLPELVQLKEATEVHLIDSSLELVGRVRLWIKNDSSQ